MVHFIIQRIIELFVLSFFVFAIRYFAKGEWGVGLIFFAIFVTGVVNLGLG